MALWVCNGCNTVYAVDAPACPHCGAVEHHGDHEFATGGVYTGTGLAMVGEHGPEPFIIPPARNVKPTGGDGDE